LKKSPEEPTVRKQAWLAEINTTLKNLRKWMRPPIRTDKSDEYSSSSKIYRDSAWEQCWIIAPWNYPFQLSLIPLVGALPVALCCAQPSELAPATAAILKKILVQTFSGGNFGVPVHSPKFNPGGAGRWSCSSTSLLRSFRFDHIFFTGSIPVGRSIYQLAAQDLVLSPSNWEKKPGSSGRAMRI